MQLFLVASGLLFSSLVLSVEVKKVEAVFPVCSNNLKTRDVAQLTIEADLMNEVLEVHKVKSGLVGVAVLDTGFDLSTHKENIVSPQFKVEKGYDSAGDPIEDSDGHGTMVAGVIGGKNGMGVAPKANLAVFRVTDPSSSSSTFEHLQASARKACEQGYSIINMSWGSVVDEAGFERGERKEKKFIEEMQSKGCLIVKAAGNSSYRKAYPETDLDDAYLRVGAVMGSGGLSPFSSLGEVYALGSSVFTLESKSKGYQPRQEKEYVCSGSTGVLINGTSFSAPLAAGIAANLVSLLKTLPKSVYNNLSYAEQIKLITHILSASQHRGSISGFRAAKIAELWVQSKSSEVLAPDDFRLLLAQEVAPLCTKPPLLSTELKEKVNEIRKYQSLCADYATNFGISYEAFKVFAESNNIEFALKNLRDLNQSFFQTKLSTAKSVEELANLANFLYQNLIKKWDLSSATVQYGTTIWGISADEAIAFLPLYYLSRLSQQPIGKEFPLLKILLLSKDFSERFSRRELRGSEEDLKRFLEALKMVHKLLPKENFLEAINEATTRKFADQQPYSTSVESTFLLGILRLVEALLTSSDFSSHQKELLRWEWQLFEKSNQSINIEVEKAAEDNPSLINLIFFSDLNDFQMSYLDGFFERHYIEIREVLTDYERRWAPERLNAFFIPYVLKSKKFLNSEARAQLSLEILARVGRFHSWNRVASEKEVYITGIREDLKIGKYALEVLKEVWLGEKSIEEKDKLKAKYREIFFSAANPDFILSQLHNPPSIRAYLKWNWERTFEKNPFVSKSDIHFVSRKFLALIPQFTPFMKAAYSHSISELLNMLVAYLDDDLHDLAATMSLMSGQWVGYAAVYSKVFPNYFTVTIPSSSRKEPAELKEVKIGWMRPVAQLVSEVLTDWTQLGLSLDDHSRKFSFWLWGYRAFRDNQSLCQLIQPLKEWRKGVLAVKEKATKERDFFGYETYQISTISDYLLAGCKYR